MQYGYREKRLRDTDEKGQSSPLQLCGGVSLYIDVCTDHQNYVLTILIQHTVQITIENMYICFAHTMQCSTSVIEGQIYHRDINLKVMYQVAIPQNASSFSVLYILR